MQVENQLDAKKLYLQSIHLVLYIFKIKHKLTGINIIK